MKLELKVDEETKMQVIRPKPAASLNNETETFPNNAKYINVSNDNEKDNDHDKDADMDADNDKNVTLGESPVMSNREISLINYLNQRNAREKEYTIKLEDKDLDKDELLDKRPWVKAFKIKLENAKLNLI